MDDKMQEEISSIRTDVELLQYRFNHIESILDKNLAVEQISSDGINDLHTMNMRK